MEDGTLRVYIVDDNQASASTAKALLDRAGHEVTIYASSVEALREIPASPPDCVLLDIMMPEVDGFDLCQQLRAIEGLADVKIIMFSSKAFEFDRRRAAEVGADGYILKPIKVATFVAQIEKVVADQVEIDYWGVRGTLPVPGPRTIRYGGNTSCVSLRFPNGKLFVFDAGTGIRELGTSLLKSGAKRIEGKIFISHPHWDHINAFPFFAPLFLTGNDFEILGASHGKTTMRELISEQMNGIYFPITIREFGANVYFRDLPASTHEIGGIEVKTMLLSHPGNCLGYRVNYHGRSICYVTDNELFLLGSDYHSEDYDQQLADFVRGTDVLITDATYTDEEYTSKVGWGHSCVSRVVELAQRGEVKKLCLFHHDPSQDDDAIDAKLSIAQGLLSEAGSDVACESPAEGQSDTV